MTGPVFVAFLIAFTGIYFMAYNMMSGYPYFSYTLSGSLIVFIVGIPLITMRSFSEERKNKTDQLLLTAPVSLPKVVLGKYLAMATVIAIPNVIFCIFPLIIRSQGTAYLTVDYISIGVFFLLGCVYAAIGMFLSALTESQIIAFISTFGILLVLYLWDGILSLLPTSAVSGLVGSAYPYHSGGILCLAYDRESCPVRRCGDRGRCCEHRSPMCSVRRFMKIFSQTCWEDWRLPMFSPVLRPTILWM